MSKVRSFALALLSLLILHLPITSHQNPVATQSDIDQSKKVSQLLKKTADPTPEVKTELPPETVSKPIESASKNEVIVDPPPAPKPEPAPPAIVTPAPIGCEYYRGLVNQYPWDTRVAMAVMTAESGCNPYAANWGDRHASCIGSFGLFQLACFWTSAPYDPATNVAKAYEIYSRSGWRPWGAYTSGKYLRYL